MIKYIFTKSDLIGSKAIRWGTKRNGQKIDETPSHFGILFMDRWVLHSNFANGVHIEPYYFFKQRNETVSAFHNCICKLSHIECQLMLDQLTKKAWGAKYDFLAVIYFTYRILLKKMFGFKMPDKNRWEQKNKWFCNELFELEFGQDLSMKTPNDLMKMLDKHQAFDRTKVFK
jgi:hypothetical protein